MAMNKSLNKFNEQSRATSGVQSDFKLRIGIALGPLVAGGRHYLSCYRLNIIVNLISVVGSGKPQYDIWGDTGIHFKNMCK